MMMTMSTFTIYDASHENIPFSRKCLFVITLYLQLCCAACPSPIFLPICFYRQEPDGAYKQDWNGKCYKGITLSGVKPNDFKRIQ